MALNQQNLHLGHGFVGAMQGVGQLLSVNDGTSTYYPTFDGYGNVSEYLDSTGTLQAHYGYDAFVNTVVSSGAKVTDFTHRFSTKPLDAETDPTAKKGLAKQQKQDRLGS